MAAITPSDVSATALPADSGRIDRARLWTVARTDLKQLIQAKDFWIPMLILGSIFFLFVPMVLLFAITRVGNVQVVEQLSTTLEVLPQKAQAAIQGDTEQGRAAFAMAVYLFAPVAVVVPLTISTAVGAATIVGEREKGTGEFLAHSPAAVREIYLGKLIASLVPGYVTTLLGFGVYSLVVNLIVGPEVGGWFFPTQEWWVLMLWVIPPFLALTLSLVLRLSARVKSTAAAQQASGLGDAAVDHGRVLPVDGCAPRRGFGLHHHRSGGLAGRHHRPVPRCARRDQGPPPRRRRRDLSRSTLGGSFAAAHDRRLRHRGTTPLAALLRDAAPRPLPPGRSVARTLDDRRLRHRAPTRLAALLRDAAPRTALGRTRPRPPATRWRLSRRRARVPV